MKKEIRQRYTLRLRNDIIKKVKSIMKVKEWKRMNRVIEHIIDQFSHP